MKRILLLEDEFPVAFAAITILEEAGFEVDTHTTATGAIAAFQSQPYDLVITDMMIRRRGRAIPDGGINLIKFIRSSSQNDADLRRVPILGISGVALNPGLESIPSIAISLGASDFLQKPFSDQRLLEKVTDLLARDAARTKIR